MIADPIVVTLDATAGVYGHDAEGRAWGSFWMSVGPFEPVRCAVCGAKITTGWESQKAPGEHTFVCAEHIVTIRPCLECERPLAPGEGPICAACLRAHDVEDAREEAGA